MNEFNISKDDWDTLTTLNTYQRFELHMSSAAKTQFTKLYNKHGKVFDMDDLSMWVLFLLLNLASNLYILPHIYYL